MNPDASRTPAGRPPTPTEAEGLQRLVRAAIEGSEGAEIGIAYDLVVRARGADVDVEIRTADALGTGQDILSFAEWLGGALRARNLSQEAAARRIGVSLKTVSRWVRGETEPRFRELRLVCDALGEVPRLMIARGSPDRP